MSTNPLKKFMRTPKIYVKLPSKCAYYDKSVIDIDTTTDEVGVMSMTSNDELTLVTPDALLNGEGIKQIILSCCPNIKDPGELISPDVDVLLLAIKYASYGEKLPFKVDCPKCEHENEYSASIRGMIDHVEFLDPPYIVELNKNLKVYVKPHSFNVNIKLALQAIETTKLLRSLDKEKIEIEDIEYLKNYSESFQKISSINVEVVLNSIEKIIIADDGDNIEVKDRDQILEWLQDIDKKTIDIIRNKVKEINAIGVDKGLEVTCEECDHQWKTIIEYNPTDFFS